MTHNANPGSEDPDPLDEGEGQQSRMIEPASEEDAPPDESEDHQLRRIDPGPDDDDPPADDDEDQQSRQVDPGPEDDDPPPHKRPQVISFFRSLRHRLASSFIVLEEEITLFVLPALPVLLPQSTLLVDDAPQ